MAKRTVSNTIIDIDTGEVKGVSTYTYLNSTENEPPYIKMYIDDLSRLYGLSSGINDVLRELVKLIDWENQITLNKQKKEFIALRLNSSLKLIEKTLNICIKKEILFRIGRGVYKANPYLFGKGSWKNILKLRLEMSYTDKGKQIELTKELRK